MILLPAVEQVHELVAEQRKVVDEKKISWAVFAMQTEIFTGLSKNRLTCMLPQWIVRD